ncbi:MAG: hypothetical protein FD149_1534, partial [Rhodospirillaceae bacterium]
RIREHSRILDRANASVKSVNIHEGRKRAALVRYGTPASIPGTL